MRRTFKVLMARRSTPNLLVLYYIKVMPGFRVYMFGSIPFPVPAAEVERGMSCMHYLLCKPNNGYRTDSKQCAQQDEKST